jgi:alkanesulfonate monooxygenase SsuD/methylene tetrahydromethanopterin reductase-like flavin-dependent oxidoreductase (luciferase family)
MRFGWLTLAHSPSPEDDARAIDEQLDQAVHAEACGFDGVWLTEHSFTGESVYCDPIPFAATLAARTSRIRIGFAVIQMALRQPIRLAIQLALLDNLTKGRLDVGIGRGTLFNEYEFAGFGLTSADARERMEEAVEVLTRSWVEAPFQHEGKYFTASLPEMRPRLFQQPHPPIWHSVVSAPSFAACGRRGVPIMTARLSLADAQARLKHYEAGLTESGLDAAAQHRLRQDAALWRHVYVGESRAEAEDSLSEALRHTRQHMNHARESFNPPGFAFDPALLNPWTNPKADESEALRFALATGAIHGTVADVKDQIAELRDGGIGHVLAQMSFGHLPHERIKASMQRFGSQIIPAFR